MKTRSDFSQAGVSTLRYERQERIFRPELRGSTAIYLFCGESNPFFVRAVVAGAGAMGMRVIGLDFQGEAGQTPHWFWSRHREVAGAINSDVEYRYLDPDCPAASFRSVDHPNSWVVIVANDPTSAYFTLLHFTVRGPEVPTLLAISGQSGVLVGRFPHARAALDGLGAWPKCQPVLGSLVNPELDVLAAGIVLNEVMLGPTRPRDDLSQSRIIAYYDLGKPRRTTVPGDARFEDLVGEVTKSSPQTRLRLAGLRSTMVGAGAIGTWAGLIGAVDGGVECDIYDGDTIEPSNLNRQVLFCHAREGERKATVLARELGLIDPSSSFSGYDRFVEGPSDLLDSRDSKVMMAVPDNDATRFRCADMAREQGLLFVTAGSSPSGGQVVISRPEGACYRCVRAPQNGSRPESEGSQSCSQVGNDSVVCSNMVVAGLLISELRTALAAVPPVNMRFLGDSAQCNRLARMITNVQCSHRD